MHFLRKPNVEKLQKDFINRRIDRRAFLGAAAAAGIIPLNGTDVDGRPRGRRRHDHLIYVVGLRSARAS